MTRRFVGIRFLWAVVAASALLFPSSALAISSAPFVSSPAAKTWYRIPALLALSNSVVLAFAERRDNASSSDIGDFDIVVRKSIDGGATWGAIKTVADDGGNRVSNPVPVLDPLTGDVLLISSIRTSGNVYRGLFVQRSSDGGRSFSPLLNGLIRASGTSHGGLPGPGHALVLAQGLHAGRILVPLGYVKDGYYGAYCIYSDDGGHSWTVGFDQPNISGKIGYMEGTLAELADGDIFVSYRNKFSAVPGTSRYQGYSYDGGETMSIFASQKLRMHSVFGSALGILGSHAPLLLFSAPSYVSSVYSDYRRDMSIFASSDGGVTWRLPYMLHLQSSQGAYSDLAQLDDGHVAVLYETGKSSWRERIVFQSVSLGDLVNPALTKSRLSGTISRRSWSTKTRPRVRAAVSISGITTPSGRIMLTATRAGYAKSCAITLDYHDRGIRYLTLPKLPRGTYQLTLRYYGNIRIAEASVSVGKITVR
jgi:sialidase-1